MYIIQNHSRPNHFCIYNFTHITQFWIHKMCSTFLILSWYFFYPTTFVFTTSDILYTYFEYRKYANFACPLTYGMLRIKCTGWLKYVFDAFYLLVFSRPNNFCIYNFLVSLELNGLAQVTHYIDVNEYDRLVKCIPRSATIFKYLFFRFVDSGNESYQNPLSNFGCIWIFVFNSDCLPRSYLEMRQKNSTWS